MSAYLRNYVESVADLPSELSRCFKLMRELDSNAHELHVAAEAASRRRLAEFAAQVGQLWTGDTSLRCFKCLTTHFCEM